MATVSVVGEIFSAAGIAFNQLAELTSLLQDEPTSADTNGGITGDHWEAGDVEALRSAVKKFGDDLASVTERVKSKKVNARAQSIKRKVFEDEGETVIEEQVQETIEEEVEVKSEIKEEVKEEQIEEQEEMVEQMSTSEIENKEEIPIETNEVIAETATSTPVPTTTTRPVIDTSAIDLPADT